MPISFTGRALRLTDAGVSAAAQAVRTTPRLLRTVMSVETAGRGFDGQGRLRMLFEPGIFYRRVPAGKRDDAVKAGLAVANMAGHRYPSDSYPLLGAAIALDAVAALESASWGLAQVMGFNHGLAGYVSADAMIADFVDSEDAHVMALAKFLKASRLVDALNGHRWADVAKGYNGLGYARNAYDTKLASAYAGLKDEPVVVVAAPLPRPTPTRPTLTRGADNDDVYALQRELDAAGYPMTVDGAFGRGTETALRAFQAKHGLPADGVAGPKTWAAFNAAQPAA